MQMFLAGAATVYFATGLYYGLIVNVDPGSRWSAAILLFFLWPICLYEDVR